jgi:acyl-lipid omega-6 desaturase (Delta-12 desaturase)
MRAANAEIAGSNGDERWHYNWGLAPARLVHDSSREEPASAAGARRCWTSHLAGMLFGSRLGMRRSDRLSACPGKGSAIPMEDGLDAAIGGDPLDGVPQDAGPANERRRSAAPWWREALAPYAQPSPARALLDIATSVVPYLALSFAMYLALGVSYPLELALAFPAAAFLVRTFILFHDCSHGSFFPSKRANVWVGVALGLLLYSPFLRWRGRAGYRMLRNPLVMFGLGPVVAMMIGPRIVARGARKRMRRSVLCTNVALAALVGMLCWLIGWRQYLLVSVPPELLAGSIGIWLFYVQHQFEHAYWENGSDWEYTDAALRGSSYLKLPKVLQFLTGNIGFHHVHHLNARIPNYNLARAHRENPILHDVPTLSLWDGLRAVRLKLWDEELNRLVTFAHARNAIP